jgi:MinD-like ATPase involved in chromosome partitioning or flagellar assembly
MAGDRYVVLGLAPARAGWFAEVARWATSSALPIDFVKLLGVEEVRARLRSGRPFSALVVDGGSPGLDRDLVELAAMHGCAVVVVDGPDRLDGPGGSVASRPWRDLGVAVVLPPTFGRSQLLDALRGVARPIVRRDELTVPPAPETPGHGHGFGPGWRGRLVAVTGSGGVGRSTAAMALASGLAADPRDRRLVVLADLALHAQQAVLHDAGDIVPGVLELVEGHRGARLTAERIRALCFAVPERGYDLLLGVRRHRDWTALRPRALAAALDGLRRTYRLVVADVDPDVEGEAECGSLDVEERNVLARRVLGEADVAVVVGQPGLTGVHAHLRVVRDLIDFGVDPARIAPVVNRAPRNPRARAELSTALARLLAEATPGGALGCTPVFVPERRRLDEIVRDGEPPPAQIVGPLTGAVRALLDRLPAAFPAPAAAREPVAVVPGTLASWSDDVDDIDADDDDYGDFDDLGDVEAS